LYRPCFDENGKELIYPPPDDPNQTGQRRLFTSIEE
jgi:hypothetical protein